MKTENSTKTIILVFFILETSILMHLHMLFILWEYEVKKIFSSFYILCLYKLHDNIFFNFNYSLLKQSFYLKSL